MKHIEIFDTTLRDGAQSAEINFSLKDKISILALLDDMGIDYAECGNVCASPVDKQLFEYFHDHKPSYHSLKPVAFMTTCRDGLEPEEDERITTSVELSLEYVSLVGKASAYHVKNVLNTTKESNLSLIDKTVRYAVGKGKKVIFCAEHFFDGCRDDEQYAFSVLKCAHDAGAETLVLCDTNGGSVMSCIEKYTKKASELFLRIGIHCHNDSGLAVANSLESVNAGAIQVHGTICGIGERCGNTDLCVLIPD
ncbi:MAG TPA: citramalate synthase, partial [Bacillota bacterium]|nr:citramalate synthase [Bacillota bacterium]